MALYVLSKSDAQDLLQNHKEVAWCLSINDVGASPPRSLRRAFASYVMEFTDFDDTDVAIGDGDPDRIVPIDERMLRNVIHFLHGVEDVSDDRIGIIHCYAGMSRSPAMATVYGALKAQGTPAERAEAAMATMRAAVGGTRWQWLKPNLRVIRLADDLLGLDGALLAAVKQHHTETDARVKNGRLITFT